MKFKIRNALLLTLIVLPALALSARAAPLHRPVQLDAIHMTTSTTGWALAGTRILHTTQGPGSWANVTPPGAAALQASTPQGLSPAFLSGQEANVALATGRKGVTN